MPLFPHYALVDAMQPRLKLLSAASLAVICCCTSPIWLRAEEQTVRETPHEALAAWLAGALPNQYEKREDWGRTRRVTVGLTTTGSGLKLRLRPKKKHVPHGIWKHYRATLPPGAEPQIEIGRLRPIAPGRVAVALHAWAPIDGWARFRIYEHGVHLGTYTLEGRSTVHLYADCEVAVRVESNAWLPAVVVEPTVRQARVKLHDFRLNRISEVDGLLARKMGSGLKRLLERELRPERITARLNRSLRRKEDRLRLDATGLLGQNWQDVLRRGNTP